MHKIPHKRIVIASMVGTTIEFYDFYIYATAAVIVFPRQFFPSGDPTTATLESLATFALAFFARPIGSAVFGHFGDGNVHYNVSQPPGMDKARFLALWDQMAGAVHDLVAEMGGSISAEHGIGQMKRTDLVRYKSPVDLALMRKIKAALDPKGILNPGKVLLT